MTNKKLLDYDIKMLADFDVQLRKFIDKEEYFGALCVAQLLIEVNLKFTIGCMILWGKFPAEDMEKYWNYSKRPAYMSDLTDYFELLGGDKGVVKQLREFNVLRNKVIHNPFSEFRTSQNFTAALKKTALLGKKIEEQLISKLYERGVFTK